MPSLNHPIHRVISTNQRTILGRWFILFGIPHNFFGVEAGVWAGPGCPTGCGSFTACSLTGINRLVYRKDDEPRTRLYNKDRVDFQEQMELYDCPAVDGVECKIPTLFLNDDFCDCPGCEDEDSHTCEDCGFDLLNDPQASVLVTADQLLTCSEECDLNISFYCIGGGFLPPGAEVFTCPSGCQIQAFAQDDGICDSRCCMAAMSLFQGKKSWSSKFKTIPPFSF